MALGDLLDGHSTRPGLDRLATARMAIFNFLVGNADAHAKNLSLLHIEGGVALAPLYDIVCTAAYPDLTDELSPSIGDELDPDRVGLAQWVDLAVDLGLQPRAFEEARLDLMERVLDEAHSLQEEAKRDKWHHAVIDEVLSVIETRTQASR